MRRTILVVAAFAVALTAALLPLNQSGNPTSTEAETADYEFEVLSGIQPAYEGTVASEPAARKYFTSTNLTMTCGWHSNWGCDNPRGLNPQGTLGANGNIEDKRGWTYSSTTYSLDTANYIVDSNGVRIIVDRRRTIYTQSGYSLDVRPAQSEWKYILDQNGHKLPIWVGPAIDTGYPAGETVWAALRANTSGYAFTAEVVDRLTSGPRCRRVEVKVFDDKNRTLATLTYIHTIATANRGAKIALPQTADEIAMMPLGVVAHPPGRNRGVGEDGSGCLTFGAHLHQWGDNSPSTKLWRNRDANDAQQGFPDPGVTAPSRTYCSDAGLQDSFDGAGPAQTRSQPARPHQLRPF